jgi:hypothetical protein
MEKKASEKMTEERRTRLLVISTTAFTLASMILPPDSLARRWSPTLYLGMVAAFYNTSRRGSARHPHCHTKFFHNDSQAFI